MALDIIGYLIIFSGAFLYGLTGALTPGPVLTAVITETPKRSRGYLTGPLIILGHAILEIGIIILAFWGLLSIIEEPIVYFLISTIGGSVLIFMAIQLFYSLKFREISLSAEIDRGMSDKSKKQYSPILQGIILSISNPYWILWWSTAGFTYAFYLFEQVSSTGMLELFFSYGLITIEFWWIATYFLGHISSDLSWYTFISSSIYAGKQKISDKTYRIVLICCGIFFSYLGVKFILCALFPGLETIFIL